MIVAAVVLPFGGAALALLARRHSPWVALLAAAGTAAAAGGVVAEVWRHGTVLHAPGGWGAPLGITLQADGLSAALLLMTAAVLVPVLAYAHTYWRRHPAGVRPPEGFWCLALLLWGGLNALFLSADAFNLYVCLELVTLAAVAMITVEGDESALTGAMRYLLAAFLGAMVFLLGVALLYMEAGRLDLPGLAAAITPTPGAYLAAALLTAALALKAALVPLHFWLPRAHAAAPAPVSALLSSLVVTAAFYLFLRLWTTVLTPLASPALGQVIGALGAIAILWGSVQALRQQRLKVMIAYSTVAQVGYLFLVTPLLLSALTTPGASWGEDAWTGAAYHAISHALAKAAMFLAAGNIVVALGDDRIVGISGLAKRLPVSTYAFGMAGMTLIGLPPSGGFVAKWHLLAAAFASGQWWWAGVVLVGGVLTAGYVFLVLSQELSAAEGDREARLEPVPRAMEYAAFTLALVALGLGVRVVEPLRLLRIGIPFPGG